MLYSRMSFIFIPIILFFCFSIAYGVCQNLSEMLDRDNPRVINYLSSLSKLEEGTKIEGLKLCDGSNPLNGLKLIEKIETFDTKQHIFLFMDDNLCDIKNHMIAIAWVEDGGSPISIPPYPDNISCNAENAYALSYDVFTQNKVMPNSEVIIISYPNQNWVKKLRKINT